MKCTIQTRHEPHCTRCNGPVEIFLYPQEPNQIIEVGFCKNGCQGSDICDGKLLDDQSGKVEQLSQREFDAFNRRLLKQLNSRPNVCLHDSKCKNKTILAHSIPRNWLKRLGGKFVYLFRPYLPNAVRPVNRSEQIPHKVSITKATTSRFCCSEHDKMFQPVDSWSNIAGTEHDFNLLFYRALLSRLHSVLSVKTMLGTHLLSEFQSRMLSPNLDVEGQVWLLNYACSLLRVALTEPVLNWRIKHVTKFIKGDPAIACASAGDWVSNWVEYLAIPAPMPIRSHGAWGVSVVPQYGGHLIVYHYCSVDPRRDVAERHLQKMKQELTFLNLDEDDALAVAVSKDLIVLTEDMCVSVKLWDSFSEEKKEMITLAWENNSYRPNGAFGKIALKGIPMDKESELNLFF